jgi:hypothetical protein
MYTVSAWDNIYPGLECEHKLFSLSHRRNLESGLKKQREKLFRKKSDEYKLFTVSSSQSGTSFRDKERKIIPEKRVMKINSSLSHRRNLESGLETKGKIIWKRVRNTNSSLSHRRNLEQV